MCVTLQSVEVLFDDVAVMTRPCSRKGVGQVEAADATEWRLLARLLV